MSLYGKVQTMTVPLSFETGLQAHQDVRFGSRVMIKKVKASVTKALAGTDAGSIAIKNAAGATIATISIPLSSAIETEHEVAIPANTFVAAGSFLRLDPTKTTAGGEVTAYIEYQNVGK